MATPLEQVKNIVLEVAYDGTEYLGWQKTSTGLSIEGVLQEALEKIVQHPISLQAASRTDRGVHAQGQIVNFLTHRSLDILKLHRSLNQLLPSNIRIIHIHQAQAVDFHPTLNAKGKEYHYLISYAQVLLPHMRYTHWHIASELDIPAMKVASRYFVGTHDFKAFCNQRKNLSYEDTHRTLLRVDIKELQDKELRIELMGDNFLYKMARNIVGTLVYVGLGKIAVADIPLIIENKKRILAGITAPAHGLTLQKVIYE
jgi:tRNA pseudouridine38-40 synthase